MTREEAITVLKAFMENPLFSDEHKRAFKIAIHDIKQRTLEQEPFINKPCVSEKVREHDKQMALSKVLEDINNILYTEMNSLDALHKIQKIVENVEHTI